VVRTSLLDKLTKEKCRRGGGTETGEMRIHLAQIPKSKKKGYHYDGRRPTEGPPVSKIIGGKTKGHRRRHDPGKLIAPLPLWSPTQKRYQAARGELTPASVAEDCPRNQSRSREKPDRGEREGQRQIVAPDRRVGKKPKHTWTTKKPRFCGCPGGGYTLLFIIRTNVPGRSEDAPPGRPNWASPTPLYGQRKAGDEISTAPPSHPPS